MRQKKILIFIMIMILTAMSAFAGSEENIKKATELAMNYRLDAKNCPTLLEVANKQLVDITWSNPGGGDQSYCFVRLAGYQKNHDFFSVIFRYDAEAERVEPYSIRNGAKETFKIDEVQRRLMRFYATESREVWQIMIKTRR